MNKKYFTPILLLLFLQNILCAQKNVSDSLLLLLKADKEDTVRVVHLQKLGNSFAISQADSAMLFYKQALALSQKLNYPIGIAISFDGIAGVEYTNGDNVLCIQDHLEALEIYKKLWPPDGGVKGGICLGNLGLVCITLGDYVMGIDYYLKALKISEQYKDSLAMSRHEGNLGIAYQNEGDLQTAEIYYFKALTVAKKIKNKRLIDYWLGNIGLLYELQGKHSEGLDYLTQALNLSIEMKDAYLISTWCAGIGDINFGQKNYVQANENYLKSLEEANKTSEIKVQADIMGELAQLYIEAPELAVISGEKNTGLKLAEDLLFRALAIADSCEVLGSKMFLETTLSKLYSKMGDDKKALDFYKKAMVAKDSLFSQDKSKEITRLEMNREFEKKDAIAKTEQEKKDLQTNEKSKQQKIIIYSIIGILLLIIVFAISLFRRFRFSQQQNRIIEVQKMEVTKANSELQLQKNLIEIHQKEIVDSINYAKRIQDAILPPIDLIKEKLPNSFVLYKPKDIIAGDFYWMEEIDNTVFIAAADCTGHGVPGAMVSVVCSNALNRAVKEFHLVETGKILDKVTDLVLETFEKSATDVKDGMDISLLAINKQSKQILWSGANNPLWYFQNGELKKIIADKQPIGKSDHRKFFTTHSLELKSNTTFYLFSDGYTDQFGGPKGKKFMHKRLQEILVDNLESSLQNQQAVLDNTFEKWKGDLEQVDDVIVIGIRIS